RHTRSNRDWSSDVCSSDLAVSASDRSSRERAFSFVGRVMITPVLPRPRLRRLVQLYVGLVLFGLSGALLVHAELGAMPWDVLHRSGGRREGNAGSGVGAGC